MVLFRNIYMPSYLVFTILLVGSFCFPGRACFLFMLLFNSFVLKLSSCTGSVSNIIFMSIAFLSLRPTLKVECGNVWGRRSLVTSCNVV
jgi:hypothetical protein